MQDVKIAAEKWIAKRIRERWPHEQQVEAIAEGYDAILRMYDVPLDRLLELLSFLPRGSPLPRLEGVEKWAKRYAEERDLTLRRVPKL